MKDILDESDDYANEELGKDNGKRSQLELKIEAL